MDPKRLAEIEEHIKNDWCDAQGPLWDYLGEMAELVTALKAQDNANLSMTLAKMAFPEIDLETVKVFSVPDDRSKVHKMNMMDNHHELLMESIDIHKYAVIIKIGYGPKTNSLVVQQTTLRKIEE
jgi:hypothetical protein